MSERSELCAVPSAREERREPAGAARRIASRPVLSLGYFSLHEQREVTRSCEAGVKALLSSTCFHALPLDLPIGLPGYCPCMVFPVYALAGLGEPKQWRKQNQGLSLPFGARATFFARAKKRGQKGALFNSRMAGQHAPASALSVPAALRAHSAAGIFRRDPAAMQLGPGQSPHGASPLTGAKQCFACFRFAPVSSKNGVITRFSVESGAGAQPHGTCPSGGAKQCFAYFRRTHARLPCGVLSVGSVAAGGDPEVKREKATAKSRQRQRQRQRSGCRDQTGRAACAALPVASCDVSDQA